jgi:SAM-dependent methyltransferase
MGLDYNGTQFLMHARKVGVSFEETAMIGRQMMNLDAQTLEKSLRHFDYQKSKSEIERLLTAGGGYSEPFLQMLGARSIVSFDASAYERATQVHDFNLPIRDEFKNRFSVVLDGGTLEHVFNFPTAIKNCMEMLREGGHFLSIAPSNNYFGHGFYQFSPELFFRIFTEANGFEMKQMLLTEDFAGSNWYEVKDPDAVRSRVTLINKQPTLLMVIAKKTKTVPIFQQTPQQSDYFTMWQKSDASVGATNVASAQSIVRQVLRQPIIGLRLLRKKYDQLRGDLNAKPQHFKKFDLP